MGFYIYEIKNGNAILVNDNVKLAGYNLIYNILKKRNIINPAGGSTGWHIPETDLINESIKMYNFPPDEEYMLVVDLKPSVKNNISLYKLTNIWGYSYETWTPIMLQLIAIYADEDATKVNFTKNKFPLPRDLENRERLHMFVYLTGGIKVDRLVGDWNWGGRGFPTAALLEPEAFKFFISAVRNYISLEDYK
ncbi:MAG: hypothetical protein DSY42_06470 [Aquifex sp.]|nr:MAG: hypothetical protein DSY42_06470 [Aquifex sp.]